jgi:osmotically-inducible protein OsmY
MTPHPSAPARVADARRRLRGASCWLAGVCLAAGALSACAPLLVGGAAVGGAMVASDRRTSGTQVDDQTIEMKAGGRVRDAIGDRGHVNVTSYNRTVLLTGEVPTEADKAKVEAAVRPIENVKNVMNELAVHPIVSLGEMSNDALITSKVKASFVDARDIFANAYKVVTEHGVVYLMGRVTEREANRAVELARGVSGVRKVVKAFEIISEDELAHGQASAAPAASAPAR